MAPGTGSIKSKRERLQEIETAIHELAIGKISSYMMGRRQITYHRLEELRKYRRELLAEIAEDEQDARNMYAAVVSFFDRR